MNRATDTLTAPGDTLGRDAGASAFRPAAVGPGSGPQERLAWSAPFETLLVDTRFSSRGRTITEADVVGFAALTGDWHPQHADATWAVQSQFGERIAHGMLIVSYAIGLVPFDPTNVVALRRLEDIVFKRPVRIGDTIHVEGRIAQLTPLTDDAGLVAFDWSVRNQTGALVCRLGVQALWRCDRASQDRGAVIGAGAEETR